MKKQKIKFKDFQDKFSIWMRKRYCIEIDKKNVKKTPADFGLDSLDMVEMQLWVEETYHVQLEPVTYSEHRPIIEFLEMSFMKITGK